MQGATMTDKPLDKTEQRQRNVRLGWILASVALIFGLGFIAKISWLGY